MTRIGLAILLLATSTGSLAQTTVSKAWVRGTVAQQRATGAFMQITSATGAKLVGASSSAAGVVEVHEMTMAGNTMKMAAVPSLDLPAGKAVALQPGGIHIMLMDLKTPLKAGDTIDITLTLQSRAGKTETVAVKALVKALGDESMHRP